jgi:hypothetical protein
MVKAGNLLAGLGTCLVEAISRCSKSNATGSSGML